jgi:hypothetical protein
LIEVNSPSARFLGEYAVRRSDQRSLSCYANSLLRLLAEDGGRFHRDPPSTMALSTPIEGLPRRFSKAWVPCLQRIGYYRDLISLLIFIKEGPLERGI